MILSIAAFLIFALPQDGLLDRAARRAESFWMQFTAVQCTERIVQNKLTPDGNIAAAQTSEFDYVAFLTETGSGLSVEESRVARSGAQPASQQKLLLTSGFPTFLLMFHPDFRDRFFFEEGVTDAARGNLVRIPFHSKPEARSLSALKLKERRYPILWKGFAWLDPASGNVKRIEAGLAIPMDDIGLSELHVELDYGPAALSGAQQPFWLPVQATISVKTPRQEWRNVHEFKQYRRFEVSTSTRQEKIQ